MGSSWRSSSRSRVVLPAPGRAGDEDELAAPDLQVDVAQRGDVAGVLLVTL